MVEKKKTKQKYLDSSKKWKENNKEHVKEVHNAWRDRNPDKIAQYRDNHYFGGMMQEVLERDNFQCQKCGMSQEQSIILFNNKLSVHHEDGNGRRIFSKNNEIDNLITMCMGCHKRLHHKRTMEERWGDLIKQDESDWKYPKLRELVQDEISNGLSVKDAKNKVADDTNMGFSSIDHRYYMKKECVNLGDSE